MEIQILPSYFAKYFWDIDASRLDVHQHTFYIIERILEYGDEKALQWIQTEYGRDKVKQVVMQSKKLSKKSAYFYLLYYQLDKKEIVCLQEDFQNKHRQIWR